MPASLQARCATSEEPNLTRTHRALSIQGERTREKVVGDTSFPRRALRACLRQSSVANAAEVVCRDAPSLRSCVARAQNQIRIFFLPWQENARPCEPQGAHAAAASHQHKGRAPQRGVRACWRPFSTGGGLSGFSACVFPRIFRDLGDSHRQTFSLALQVVGLTLLHKSLSTNGLHDRRRPGE